MSHDGLLLTGQVRLAVSDPHGRLLSCVEAPNTVVEGGRYLVTRLLSGLASAPSFSLVAGIDDKPTAPGLTALYNTDDLAPVPAAEKEVMGGLLRLKAAFPPAEKERIIREAGLILSCQEQDETVSSLYNRALVRPPQSVRVGETLTMTWTLTFTAQGA